MGCLTCLTLGHLRRGAGGDGDPRRWRKRETIPITLTHHQNDFCMKMNSSVSHFIVSLTVRAQSQDSVKIPQLLVEEKGEPKGYRTKVLLLSSVTL